MSLYFTLATGGGGQGPLCLLRFMRRTRLRWAVPGCVAAHLASAWISLRGSVPFSGPAYFALAGAIGAQYCLSFVLDRILRPVNAPFAATLLFPLSWTAWTYEKSFPVLGGEDILPGDGIMPVLDTPHERISCAICLDMDHGGFARQAASMRAIENGYAIVRCCSDGLAAFIVLSALPVVGGNGGRLHEKA